MPESSSRVQLVRCPKCNLLLPELPPYSLYNCGGCGALSRAEKRSSVDDGVSEKSWEDRIGEDLGREDDRLSKSTVRSRHGEGNRRLLIRGSGSGNFDAQSKSSGRSMERNVHDYEDFETREKVGAWFGDVKEEDEYGNRFVAQKGSADPWLHYEANGGESEFNRPRVQPRSMDFGLNTESDYDDMYGRRRVDLPRQQRFPVHPNDESSNLHSNYGYDQTRYSQEIFSGSSSVRSVEMSRAEQFRLYDEVKKQLGITSDLPENSNRRGHQNMSSANFYGGSDDYVHDDLVRSGRSVESVGVDERARMRLYHMNRNQSPAPFVNERDLDHDPSWPQYHGRISHNRPHVQFPPDFGNRRYLNSSSNPSSEFPDPYGHHNLSSHSQGSADSKSYRGGSVQEHGKRLLLVKKNQLLCHPIVGAAPLVICNNCSQLLRIPKKLIVMKKTQFKLQCGSCRTALSFDFTKKKLQMQLNHSFPIVHDVPAKIHELDDITNNESFNFDATGYKFPSTDSETGIQLDAQRRLGHFPSPYNVLKEDNLDELAANKPDVKESHALGHDADARTELELNTDEIPIADLSLSSTEASSKHEGDGNEIGRFASPLNPSNVKTDVFVNGQPLPYRVVKRAEKLAGPVSPGNYWYDSRAGFWGVMGNYCLGIIPPFITEFGFPMPLDCSSGDTGIYVNGRELNVKDLELLARRGLPRTRGKWYVIDISGKVQDEETGDAVVDLGKLAPSVEKAKHGFGMRPS